LDSGEPVPFVNTKMDAGFLADTLQYDIVLFLHSAFSGTFLRTLVCLFLPGEKGKKKIKKHKGNPAWGFDLHFAKN